MPPLLGSVAGSWPKAGSVVSYGRVSLKNLLATVQHNQLAIVQQNKLETIQH